MDPTDPHTFEVFLEIYGTLPRAGPGGDEHTRRALELVPGPDPQRVLDLGCGPGAQTLVLASALPEAEILAVDLLPSMVESAAQRFDRADLGDRVTAVVGDMAAPEVPPASQDLIWCEGAIYNLGVTAGLRAWRPLLRAGGTVAFTEPIWLVEEPPGEIRDWWHAEYPSITDAAGIRSSIDAAAYETVAWFPLPASAWWDEYYEPMLVRIDEVRQRRAGDPTAAAVIAAAEDEIDRFRRFSTCYAYAFFIARVVS